MVIQKEIHPNALRAVFLFFSFSNLPPQLFFVFLPLFMCTRLWLYRSCVLETWCVKALGLQEFDHSCIYAVWCGGCRRCSVSSVVQMHAYQVVEISGCVSKQTLAVTWPLILCQPAAHSLRNAYTVHFDRSQMFVDSIITYHNFHIMMPDTILALDLNDEVVVVAAVCVCVCIHWRENNEQQR